MKSEIVLEVNRNGDIKEFVPNIIKFSDGTIQVNLLELSNIIDDNSSTITLKAKIVDSDGIIALMQINDILNYYFDFDKKYLKMDYTPYARYDRRMVGCDSFSLKVFANLINSMKFDKVFLCDVHSNMSTGLIDNSVELLDQLAAFNETVKTNFDIVVSPDAGAYKKANSIAECYKKPLIVARKKRNVSNGYLEFDGIDFNGIDPSFIEGKNLIIADDICDGGKTFEILAENLRKYKPVSITLFVSHGLFSKGKKLKHIDNIFAYNDLSSYI